MTNERPIGDRWTAELTALCDPYPTELDEIIGSVEHLAEITDNTRNDLGETCSTLAAMGLTADEIPTALRNSVDLTERCSLPLSKAAEVLVTVGYTYEMGVSEYPLIVEAIAEASVTHHLPADDVFTALRRSGPVANTLGYSVRQTVTMYAVLESVGLTGEVAGEHIREILIESHRQSGERDDNTMEKDD